MQKSKKHISISKKSIPPNSCFLTLSNSQIDIKVIEKGKDGSNFLSF